MTDSSNRVDADIGGHDVDRNPVPIGDEEIIDFEVEFEAVFKRLAEDIYTGPEAGLREPLTNAITAVIRAQEEGYIGEDDGVVNIQVHDDSDGTHLVIEDNGIGIQETEIREIISVIGRSGTRSVDQVAGRFGIGFLAVWMLTGLNGGFVMHTNSRENNNEPISGVWKNGGFTPANKDEMYYFDEDEYGTRLEITLQDSISATQVESWVNKYAEWARVPVVYQWFQDGDLDHDDEIGGQHLLTKSVSNTDSFYVVETPYFTAVNSRVAGNNTILLDVPVDVSVPGQRDHIPSNVDTNYPLINIDIRLKYESGIVVDGPNEGKIPVGDNEYEQNGGDTQSKYIRESQLKSNDIVLPKPTGTRDTLSFESEFWNWLGEQFTQKYYNEVQSLYKGINTKDDLFNLSYHDTSRLKESLQRLQQHSVPLDTAFRENLGIDIDDDILSLLKKINSTVAVSEKRVNPKKHNTTNRKIFDVMNKAHRDDAHVFMTTKASKKSKIVMEDNPDNQIVFVRETSRYKQYEEAFGWTPLRDIDASNIDNFDVSDETKEEFTSTNSNINALENPDKREITLRHGPGNATSKPTAEGLLDSLSNLSKYSQSTVVLFPSNSDLKISSYSWAASSRLRMANCTVSVWEYLSDSSDIIHAEDWLEQSKQYELTTSEGTYTVEGLEDEVGLENVIVHRLEEDVAHLLKQKELMNHARDYIEKQTHISTSSESVYVPLSASEFAFLRAVIHPANIVSGDMSRPTYGHTRSTSVPESRNGMIQEIRNDTRIYAYARLPDWHGTDALDGLLHKYKDSLSNDGYAIVETLGKRHDNGQEPVTPEW